MTSDRAPSDIPAIEARLVTRFQWGMVTDIEPPDFEHRVAILRKKAQVDRLEHAVPDEVLELLAESVTSSVRELEGSVIRLLAYSSLKQKPITLELAKQIIHGATRFGGPQRSPNLSAENILNAIAAEWGLQTEALISKSRTKSVVIPRQAAIYLCRKLLGMSLMEIGATFGSRDHSTVIYSLQKAQTLLDTDQLFASKVAQTEQRITTPAKT
jgi:chromosomal replication initiator protein